MTPLESALRAEIMAANPTGEAVATRGRGTTAPSRRRPRPRSCSGKAALAISALSVGGPRYDARCDFVPALADESDFRPEGVHVRASNPRILQQAKFMSVSGDAHDAARPCAVGVSAQARQVVEVVVDRLDLVLRIDDLVGQRPSLGGGRGSAA